MARPMGSSAGLPIGSRNLCPAQAIGAWMLKRPCDGRQKRIEKCRRIPVELAVSMHRIHNVHKMCNIGNLVSALCSRGLSVGWGGAGSRNGRKECT